jgi:hypothetical protein
MSKCHIGQCSPETVMWRCRRWEWGPDRGTTLTKNFYLSWEHSQIHLNLILPRLDEQDHKTTSSVQNSTKQTKWSLIFPKPGEKNRSKDWSEATGMKFFFVLFCAYHLHYSKESVIIYSFWQRTDSNPFLPFWNTPHFQTLKQKMNCQ